MTGEFGVLDAVRGRAEWLAVWRRCGREPFAHPDYVTLNCEHAEDARCAVLHGNAGATAMLPFTLRSVSGLPWEHGIEASDATSPYGYGGPYGARAELFHALLAFLKNWLREQGLVSLFVRMAVGESSCVPLPGGYSLITPNDNVVVDLTRPDPEQWMHYEHKVRKNVRKAMNAGLTCSISATFTDLTEFAALYEETMKRRNAESGYYFGLGYFERVAERLRGSYYAVEVRDASKRLVSAELVLCSQSRLYSFLGGTTEDAFEHRPNDLLKHEVICFGHAAGYLEYVLGGGLQRGDGIFKYKRSFDIDGVVPYNCLCCITNEPLYEQLALQRARAEVASEAKGTSYFPIYRAPLSANRTEDWRADVSKPVGSD